MKNPFHFLSSPLLGRKGHIMPDPISPPATGLTAEQVSALLTQAIAQALPSALAAAVKPLNDSVAELQRGQTAIREAQGNAVTKDQVAQAVRDSVATQTASAEKSRSKTDFVAQNLKGVPSIYATKLGDDPAKWGDEAKVARETFQADLKAAGVKAPPLGSDPAAGTAGTATPAQVADTSKLTGYDLIAMGVKQNSQAILPAQTAAPLNAAEAAAANGATTATK